MTTNAVRPPTGERWAGSGPRLGYMCLTSDERWAVVRQAERIDERKLAELLGMQTDEEGRYR